jgi:hypothetical protein
MAVKLRRYTHDAKYALKPWLLELALARLGTRSLSVEEQRVVVDATHKPDQVKWPEWWGRKH